MTAAAATSTGYSAATDRHAKPSATYAAKLEATEQLLTEAARDHARVPGASASRITQASSLGAEDVVVSHLIDSLRLDIDTFVLDTGMLHAETLALLAQFKAGSSRAVRVFEPEPLATVKFVAKRGKDAMYQSIDLRRTCCAIRKTEPLARALTGYDGWITGMRREQSAERAVVPLMDESQPRTKYNPLAEWTQGDVWHYIARHGVAYNPLHDDFFPSIGCAPCTRAVSLGEDPRAGRWWWEDDGQKECGLHVQRPGNQPVPTQTAHTQGTPA